jgi:hypothetical protein
MARHAHSPTSVPQRRQNMDTSTPLNPSETSILRFLNGERLHRATHRQIARGLDISLDEAKASIISLQQRDLLGQRHQVVLEPQQLHAPLETGYFDGSNYVVRSGLEAIEDVLVDRTTRFSGDYEDRETIRPFVVYSGTQFVDFPTSPFRYGSNSDHLQRVELLLAQKHYTNEFRKQFGAEIASLDNWRAQKWLRENLKEDGVYPDFGFFINRRIVLGIFYAIDFAGAVIYSDPDIRKSAKYVVQHRLRLIRAGYRGRKRNYEIW